jgi:hypothetical protein
MEGKSRGGEGEGKGRERGGRGGGKEIEGVE